MTILASSSAQPFLLKTSSSPGLLSEKFSLYSRPAHRQADYTTFLIEHILSIPLPDQQPVFYFTFSENTRAYLLPQQTFLILYYQENL